MSVGLVEVGIDFEVREEVIDDGVDFLSSVEFFERERVEEVGED